MNKEYKELFAAICEQMETLAERVMEHDKEKGDLTGYKTSQDMRGDFARLHTLFASETVDYKPNAKEVLLLSLGAQLIITQLEAEATKLDRTIKHYKEVIIPKLQAAHENTSEIDTIFGDINN